MTQLTYDPDHALRGVDRLIDRYRKPRTSALLASWLDEVQQAEDALWQLLVERWLATAVGVQLDVLGAIVGQPRQGRDDDLYRLWISARNLVNRSSGKTTELLTIARKLVAATDVIVLEEYYPAAFVMRLSGDISLDLGYQIAYMLRLAKGAGILFQMTWPVSGTTTFRFAPGDTPVPGSEHGFDAGVWAVVADGSFIPSEEPESLIPPGAITILGVPITVEGEYVVISPTTALAKPKPLMARIVPRAPLAPTLLADTVELVDTFDDASLEMNTAGDKFRVAEAVQLAVVEHGAALDVLEPQVAAMRFEFTLRTTSIDSLDFTEVAVMRFDASAFDGALVLVAELEVAAAGQTVELELWNLTAAALVASLSSTSLVTEEQSTPVTLPLSDALYSVRLRRVGGEVSQRVSCRGVALEADHG